MKKLCFCLVVLLSIVSLNSCDEKSRIERDVKNQLKKHLQRSMNDADSYELVEFNMFRNEEKKKQDSLDLLILVKHVSDDKEWEKVNDSLRKARDITIGEYDRHGLIRYRGKNSFGATVINQSTFNVKISSDNRSEVYEIGGEQGYISDIE